MGIKAQFEVAKALQIHESFRLVAAEALGGKSGSKSSASSERPVETMDELMMKVAALGGRIGG